MKFIKKIYHMGDMNTAPDFSIEKVRYYPVNTNGIKLDVSKYRRKKNCIFIIDENKLYTIKEMENNLLPST